MSGCIALLLLFALSRRSALFSFFLLARLALLLFALLTFLLCRAFCCQSRFTLFPGLALSVLLFSALGLETFLLFSSFALAFCLTLLLLRSSPPALLLFPRFLFFSMLSSRLSPRLLLFTLLFLRCLELGLLLPKRDFLGGLFSCPLRTLLLFGHFLLPAPPQSQSGTIY
jgi:hypothetical protein